MIAWRNMTIKAKLFTSVVAFTVVLSLALTYAASMRIATDLREQLLQRGRGLAFYMVEQTQDTLKLRSELGRYFSFAFLTSRIAVGDVIYAQIVVDGKVQSQHTKMTDIPLDILTDQPEQYTLAEKADHSQHYFDIIRPLPTRRGYVRLGLSLDVVDEKVQKNFLLMGSVSLLFAALGIAFAFGLYSAVLRPIEHVIGSIKRLAEGDMQARVEITRKDELRHLTESFNRMADAIGERNQKLRQTNDELREANETKTRFLTMMGHELKTPLHTIRGSCQLLLVDNDTPKEARRDIEAILAAGNHLLALIDNILKFRTLGSDQLHRTSVSLTRLAVQCADYVAPLAKSKGIEVRVNADDAGSAYVDETKVRQILINLLDNATRYSQGGCVSLDVKQTPAGHFFSVSDTGPGIAAADVERIFQPFERIDRGDSPEQKGLGVGLAIVRHYAAMHDGEVTVESEMGKGSTFRVFLPRTVPGKTDHEEVRFAG